MTGLALLASAGWVTPATDIVACEATLTPASVQISPEPVSVEVTMSEPIGEVGNVMAHSDSGIKAGPYNAEMGSLTLGLADAKPGEWPITFHGEDEASCAGAITVTEEAVTEEAAR